MNDRCSGRTITHELFRHDVLVPTAIVHPPVDACKLVADVAVEAMELEHVTRMPCDVQVGAALSVVVYAQAHAKMPLGSCW